MTDERGRAGAPFFLRRAVLSLFLLCAGATAGLGSDSYVAATTPVFAQPNEAKPIGKLLVAAPLERVGPVVDGWQQISLSGWTQAGAERALQAAPGLRVTRAVLAKQGLDALAFGETRTDSATGLDWTRTTLTGWVPSDAALSPDLDTLWARAETLFSTRCIVCHERRVPARYTANQWTSYLKVMGPRARLSDDDQALIRVFLQYRSADAAALAEALADD